jgi:hypothetical protein
MFFRRALVARIGLERKSLRKWIPITLGASNGCKPNAYSTNWIVEWPLCFIYSAGSQTAPSGGSGSVFVDVLALPKPEGRPGRLECQTPGFDMIAPRLARNACIASSNSGVSGRACGLKVLGVKKASTLTYVTAILSKVLMNQRCACMHFADTQTCSSFACPCRKYEG